MQHRRIPTAAARPLSLCLVAAALVLAGCGGSADSRTTSSTNTEFSGGSRLSPGLSNRERLEKEAAQQGAESEAEEVRKQTNGETETEGEGEG
ncbi:MAG TPA: hypothetical protein VFW29_04200 [Solirubrobacteraceae bacterium]|nr:hypothetical protein [Solirubrobacteraceae bacterium]